MARGRASTFELQRGAILAAAAALFAERGFHNASMSELAKACGVSKPLLYHYYRDKEHILFDIADSYVDGLLAIVAEVEAQAKAKGLAPEAQLRLLVERFMEEYADAQHRHVVLVQDVKFLQADEAEQVTAKQRRLVAAFAKLIERVQPGLKRKHLDKPVTMILFGMMNWTFTWLRGDGRLTYADMAPIVTGILLDGVKSLAPKKRAAVVDG